MCWNISSSAQKDRWRALNDFLRCEWNFTAHYANGVLPFAPLSNPRCSVHRCLQLNLIMVIYFHHGQQTGICGGDSGKQFFNLWPSNVGIHRSGNFIRLSILEIHEINKKIKVHFQSKVFRHWLESVQGTEMKDKLREGKERLRMEGDSRSFQ